MYTESPIPVKTSLAHSNFVDATDAVVTMPVPVCWTSVKYSSFPFLFNVTYLTFTSYFVVKISTRVTDLNVQLEILPLTKPCELVTTHKVTPSSI